MRRPALRDIVTMSLPTRWSPSGRGGGGYGGPGGPAMPSGYGPGTPGATAFANAPGGATSPGLMPGQTATGLVIPEATYSGKPEGDWTPNLIVPQSQLPQALQRFGIVKRSLFNPNGHDVQLMRQARMWEYIADNGGLRSCCFVPELGRPLWSQPPWQVMPSNGKEYRKPFALDVNLISGGPPFDGTDTLLGSWIVPHGFDGLLNRVVTAYEGTATPSNFTGDIVWRVRVNNRYPEDLGNITYTYGSLTDQMNVPGYGVRLVSGQTVYVFAAIAIGAAITDGIVMGATFGWTYPRR